MCNTLKNLQGRSLLTWLDYSASEIRALLELARNVKHEKHQQKQRFAGISIALLFEKRSTRTRCAFETAVGEEGGHPVFLSNDDIQLGAKETIEDTARVLGRMFSAIEFRGFKQSTAEALAAYSGVPVYNGLTDLYHPTQALADVMTLEEEFGDMCGKKLCFVGDGRNNVARSLIVMAAKLGINITVVCPPELQPGAEFLAQCAELFAASGAVCEISHDTTAVCGADAIYTDVWASMGEEAQKTERVRLLAPYQVNRRLFEQADNKSCVFLHCLPAVRGEEVTKDIIDGPQSRVWDEAENRKHTIKAIILATLGLI
ncbi:MAG: ornithine carbamoyltransferase [Spirochaetaceae bacterium]|jgi:ornithine carbamoyltransferase|nr:ornithine carbamoyltransferase [Spirochaetaceae bacterium]